MQPAGSRFWAKPFELHVRAGNGHKIKHPGMGFVPPAACSARVTDSTKQDFSHT